MKNKVGIIIGRFQPFHNGHKALIDKSLAECEKTIVFIGSANKLPDFQNPFSNEERKELISRCYTEHSDRLTLVYLHDKPNREEWTGNIYGYLNHIVGDIDPSLATMYTSSKDKEFYEETLLFPVATLDAPGISGTSIRSALYKEEGIPKTLPGPVTTMLRLFTKTQHWDRMKAEHDSCVSGKSRAVLAHAFNNPIEPVVHAVVVQDNKVLVIKRNSVRGYGQWAIPGGFLEKDESTQAGAVRELKEETGVDLMNLQCGQLAVTVEENIGDLSVRTLGINYLFAVKDDEDIHVDCDPKEVLDWQWVDLADILNETTLLFYNHNLVVQRLMAEMAAESAESKEAKEANGDNQD